MLRTLDITREQGTIARLAGIVTFTLLTALAARVTLEIGAVPLTLQTLAVFLAGMVLGARDGALSQLLYVSLIVLGLPWDARGLGTAVFAGPTWGYLVGFIPCAFVAGYLVEHAGTRIWQRVAAGLVGSIFVFVPGMIVLKYTLGLTWDAAFTSGVAEFMVENFAKAMIAGAMAEGARQLLLRVLNPTDVMPS
jgi:biotin transport system substrate-specific component